MKKILLAIAAVAVSASAALADYRLIVPQKPGGGTSVWATIVSKHLEKFVGEPVIVEHIPGAQDIPGFNKFHNELQKDPKVIMVAHGGNAESFLTDKVDYDYDKYDPIALVNLNITVSHMAEPFDPYSQRIKFGSTSGRRPDVMAMTLLACGPKKNVDEYIECFKEHITFVKGMDPTEARLAALRGELNVVRETFVSQKKFIEPIVKEGKFKEWFNHGVLDLKTGKIVKDKNFTSPSFEEAYKAKWGKAPSGEFYDAYVLVKNYRDVLQKSLWVGKNNPNKAKLQQAVRKMLEDPEAKAEIVKDGGDYEWFIGDDMLNAYNKIKKSLNEKSLQTLVKFTNEALEINSVYKPEILK